MLYFLSAVFVITYGITLYWVIRMWLGTRRLKKEYGPLTEAGGQVKKLESEHRALSHEMTELRQAYNEKKFYYDTLIRQAAIYDEEIELAELGFYKPHFDFGTSERFKEQIARVRQDQKSMISNKSAITCAKEWTVEGSAAKGRTMINRAIRLTARAFNNECDAAISNTRWNNVTRMEQRIEKAFDAINKLNESNFVSIAPMYLRLKLDELRLTYEYKDKKQKEKEEQAEIRQQMREEAKLEQEKDKALREEERYQKLLEKAKENAALATGEKLQEMQAAIAQLEHDLAEAHSKSERAISMAQQTRAGHIYVISNIGSFGENVYKIGMTRRLEPLDRVKELGDASVPFLFDVHAMIYSDDAPTLEKELHSTFDSDRLNLVNTRKEFFRLTLDEIEREVTNLAPHAEFVLTAEAREFKESQSIRSEREDKLQRQAHKHSLIPDSI